jgi:4-methylaminobutanoate oxidase (formaldehyde-forming)
VSVSLPSQTRVLIIGGGVAGTSVAWHLTQLGVRDVVLVEQNKLAGGTSWHAAGMVGRLRVSSSMMRINQDSADLYAKLKEITGHDIGWRMVGSLLLARNRDRVVQFRRTTGVASYLGVECHEITPAEAQAKFPCIRVDDLAGAFWIPHDGRVLPGEVPLALAKGARAGGAQVIEGVRVARLLAKDGRVIGAETNFGTIHAEVVVLTGGMWTRQLALTAGVNIPLHPVEHHYVVSNPLPGADGNCPCTRDMDGSTYFRGEDLPEGGGGVLLGAFQRTTKIWDVARVPDDFSFGLLEPDWEKFSEPLAQGLLRIPGLKEAGFAKFVNGPESFTPDNNFLLGETAELRGLFVAAGFNSAGIACAGGAGKALAEWILGGAMPYDLTGVDIRRFGGWANNRAFLRDRVTESLGLHYEMAWPNREPVTARDVRLSPLHGRLKAVGACFGTKGGWERPNWFARPEAGCAAVPEAAYSFGRQNWFANHAFEHRACRERVAVFDQTGFAKLLVRGTDACAVLQRVCGNNVDVAPGKVVYTGLFNERGGFESDLTVVRVSRDEFYLITGSAQAARDASWLRWNLKSGECCEVVDVTAAYAVLGVMGPRSRDLLSRIADADLGNAAFPFGTAQVIGVGMATVRAVRLTYVGELGWELHVPVEQAGHVYDLLMATGADLGVAKAGHYAINSLRLEKGYRAFGAELSPDETPFEAGLAFAVDFAKDFLGRAAMLAAKERPRKKLLTTFVLNDPEPPVWGGEVIFRNGVGVGYTTSGSYGHTVGGGIAMGYVKNGGEPVTPEWILAGRYELLVDGRRIVATPHLRPVYDPKRERILG